eukprot:8756047-Alexandrium_andersonii.AAC.1
MLRLLLRLHVALGCTSVACHHAIVASRNVVVHARRTWHTPELAPLSRAKACVRAFPLSAFLPAFRVHSDAAQA